jgi:hypothetical protein
MHAAELATALVAQREAASHWLNQIMLQLMDLRDAVEEGRTERVTAILEKAREQYDVWVADWARGRDDGRERVEAKRPSMVGMFFGEKVASRLDDRPDQRKRGEQKK